MRIPVIAFLLVAATGIVSAHVIVSPIQARAGVEQRYELRVHNEMKVATTSVELQVPDDVVVLEVGTPPAGTVTTKKAGDRTTAFTWTVDVAPNKYLALPFTAKNPAAATEIHWRVSQHLADGSVVEWSDAPGAQQKAPVTRIIAGADQP